MQPLPQGQGGTDNLVDVVCPLCGSEISRHLYSVRDNAFQVTDATFGVRRCSRCGCGFLSPRPREDDMQLYYPKAYYWSYEGSGGELSWEELIAKRRGQLAAKARWLEDMKPGRLLDIGAMKGEFLWTSRQAGWDVEGVELKNSVPNPLSLPIRYGDFLAMDFDPSGYDCVTMWAVLEHIYAPAKFVERVASLLRPGGRFIATVTNFNSVQGGLFRQDDYPRHLTLFTKKSIRHLCARYGLVVARMETDQTIFGGALNGGLVFTTKRLFGYTASEAFAEWKQTTDPELFCCSWRGHPSPSMRTISRADRVITLPIETLFDRLGLGFNLTFSAARPLP